MSDWALRLGFSTLLAPELDAIARGEWRFLPLFRALSGEAGYVAFVRVHVPLVAVLRWLCFHSQPEIHLL